MSDQDIPTKLAEIIGTHMIAYGAFSLSETANQSFKNAVVEAVTALMDELIGPDEVRANLTPEIRKSEAGHDYVQDRDWRIAYRDELRAELRQKLTSNGGQDE